VPELRGDLATELSRPPGETGLYIIFGLVAKRLFDDLRAGADLAYLPRMFDFLERMATSEDGEIQNLLQVEICGRLGDDRSVLRRAHGRMRPQTREASDQYERALGRTIPGPP
jgi:hypothetical protein